MREMIFGASLLMLLLGFQWGMGRWKQHRLKIWWGRADAACRDNDFDTAEIALQKCVTLLPLWVPARILLGSVYSKRGDFNAAEEQLKMASELQPRKPEGHMSLGLFYADNLPDYADAALEALAKAVTCAPELRESLIGDPRVSGLKEHPRYHELVD
jgi:tetratricopeptide (TPR) repeat protein